MRLPSFICINKPFSSDSIHAWWRIDGLADV
jgi:hypothetical protein